MKIKNILTTALLMGTLMIAGILIAEAYPGQTLACNGCHAYPPTTINITTNISSIMVNPGQSFTVGISWSGGNPAGTTEVNWPTSFSSIGITRDNALFNPTPRIPASALNTPSGTTISTLTAPTTNGSYIVRVYASRFSPWETDFKDIAVTTGVPNVTATPTPTATPPAPGGFDQNTPITTTHGNITAAQIAEIQPGLGTVMREYAYRFWAMYYAAKSGNWGLAQYQLKEAREIQEVGETTRPGRAAMLKAFEASYLDPLQDTMNATDWNAFQTQYNNTVVGCNGCHAANGFSYINYTLPSHPPNLLFAVPTTGLKGDVNGDGQVTVVDALFVSQYTVGARTLTSSQLAAADVNGDGQVTVVDALFIAQYTVGLRQL